MANLWERLTHLYGHKFTSTFGEAAVKDGKLTGAAQTWASGMRGLTGEQIAQGLRACFDRAEALPPGKEDWPPTAPEFVAMCKGPKQNGLGLDYLPEYYRPRETRPERLLEPSDELKQARRDAAAKGIQAMREKIMAGNSGEQSKSMLFQPLPPDERDFRLMVMLHTLREDYPISRRLKVVRGFV